MAVSVAACGGLFGGGGGGGDGGGDGPTTTVGAPTTTLPITTTTIPFGTTSTTIPLGTTSTTEAPPTTLPGPHDTCPAGSHPTCKATFRLKNITTLGGLQFDVDYGAVAGCFKGIAGNVQCNAAPQIDAVATFNDDDASKSLHAGFISIAGITGPTNVAVCNFIGATTPNATKFRIDVVEAVEPDLTPGVGVVGVTFDCTGGPTTTTVPGPTTTTVAGPTTTSTTSTTLAVEGTEFDVTLRLNDNVTLGGLQIVVDYSQAPGEFRGSGALASEGGTLECIGLLEGGTLSQFNDDDAGSLTMGFVSIGGFDGPVDLARCIFDRDGLGLLSHDGFSVRVDDATTPDVVPVLPRPEVAVSRIVAR